MSEVKVQYKKRGAVKRVVIRDQKSRKPVSPDEARKKQRIKAQRYLDKHLSDAFWFWKKNVPLAIGFHDQLFAYCESHNIRISRRGIRLMLRQHVLNKTYQYKLCEGANRFDINGTKVGKVTFDELPDSKKKEKTAT